ncbi:DUF721 domain-containing protein [Oceaniglobus roseus]|uniref:DUF721 domain-containing protein n=1 Tax=Oceaniglobus roseus TaxID=1737570 RepID=UPI000C7EAD45|nr:DUF721 domain-containing protein [Kandeliimicrobium roseum]
MVQRKTPAPRRGIKGFQSASALLQSRIREAGEQRGFAVTRLLTHWAEIVGPDVAGISRPANVSYGRGGFGATLSLLTTGAQAPMLEMQKEKIRERVNACYGYAAISRVRITQTAPTGFAEGQVSFDHRPKKDAAPAADPETAAVARAAAAPVGDAGLRAALEALGQNVLSARKQNMRPDR